MKQAGAGCVYLVGAGPGDPGLLTLRARELFEQADVIVYDRLVNEEILIKWARPDAELVFVGKTSGDHTMPQEEINALLVRLAGEGKEVMRLKGGDPFIFGRGGEEARALVDAGIPFEIVPGITSGYAVPAYAGIPLSHRDSSGTIALVTGHESKEGAGKVDWEALARSRATLVVYMGARQLPEIMGRLKACGVEDGRPVAFIQWGSIPRQRTVVGTLGTIHDRVEKEGLSSPAIIVVGEVARLHEKLNWFENKPLFGKRVVVTRTSASNRRLGLLLGREGAEVIELPTLKIEPHEGGRDWSLPLPEADWLVFSSPSGVEHFFDFFLREHDIRELGRARIAAVGPSTADKLREYRLKVDLVPPATFSAAGLVEAWPEAERNRRVLFLCGNLAGREIKEGLAARGCGVGRIEVYRNLPETRAGTPGAERLCAGGADWILFCSSSAVSNFHRMALDYPHEGIRYASIGPVTSAAMRDLGYPVDAEAAVSSLEALVEAIR